MSAPPKKKTFLRAISRKPTRPPLNPSPSQTFPRGLSRKRTICEKLTRTREQPVLGSRALTGPMSLKAKEKVLLEFPNLAILHPVPGHSAQQLVYQGANSIRAELFDMNAMLNVMLHHNKMLSHPAVQRFYDWIPIFETYLERYMTIEEDFILTWLENSSEKLKAGLRPSARMIARGKIQKKLADVLDLHQIFKPHLPAGELLSQLISACHEFTDNVIDYFSLLTKQLPDILTATFTNDEIEKTRTRILKHIVQQSGCQDFIAIYTRWMSPAELLEWKTTKLFPCDFKFFSYNTWEKDMDAAHYQIAAKFGELLEEENKEQAEFNKQRKADFDRARATRQAAAATFDLDIDGLDVVHADEEEYEEE